AAPTAKLGLPEIKLGIIPGAGGTQRLPRLVGAAKAFPMMLSGEPVSAEKAAQLGLVDAIAPDDLVVAPVALPEQPAGKGEPRRTSAQAEVLTDDDREAFETLAAETTKKSGDMPNAMALIEAVRGVFTLPFAEGLAAERALFTTLVADERSKALRHVFFAERE